MTIGTNTRFHQWGRKDELVAALRDELLTSKTMKEIYAELCERFGVTEHSIHKYANVLYFEAGDGGRLKLMGAEIARLRNENAVLKRGNTNGIPRILSGRIHRTK